MSSLAPAPEAAGPRARHSDASSQAAAGWHGVAPAVAIAAAFTLLAVTTRAGGGVAADAGNVVSQMVLVALAGAAGIAAIALGIRTGSAGRLATTAFATLAVLTFASIAWSVQPAVSWLEADRTLSYLAAFVLGIALARAAPSRGSALAGGLALYSLAICLWALLARVFPAALDASDALGRLGVPFGYYNATGLVAAMGVPAWLWLGTRGARGSDGAASRVVAEPGAAAMAPGSSGRGAGAAAVARGSSGRGARAAAVAAVPATAVLVTTLLLSYSRGALVVAAVGLAVWFALVSQRFLGAFVLAPGVIGGAAVGVWATAQHSISHDYVALPLRNAAGHRLGVVLLLALIVLTGAGVAVFRARPRVTLPPRAARRIVLALRVGAALVPVLVLLGLAASPRGLTGEVSHLWSSLTDPHAIVPDAPGRLGELGSSRPRYWGDGMQVGSHAPLVGVGAGGFAVAVRRYVSDRVAHAHSYLVQTFSDLGVLGLLLSAALLIACARGWRATVRAAPGEEDARAVLGVVLGIAVLFGLHSAIDWTWFVPGCAVPAIVCAGWAVAWRAGAAADPGAAHGYGGASPWPARIRAGLADPLRAGGALALLAVVVLAAWFVWQPLRSADAQSAAEDALLRGAAGQALTDARTAASAVPVDSRPHELIASILLSLRRPAAARAELLEAARLQPSNPDPWFALGAFDTAHRLPSAAGELARAHALDPFGT